MRLQHVALLKREPGVNFYLSGNGLSRGLHYVRGEHVATLPSSPGTALVEVCMECCTLGVFEQWVVFDFGRRPVLMQKIKVKVGRREAPQHVPGSREDSRPVNFMRWDRVQTSCSGAGRAYSERVEAYNQRYAYMKSWAGLLRILCVAELLLGAAVFACVTAYVHKDNEWYNMFGYSQPYGYGAAGAYGGYSYSGPKTPFVLVVAGLAWIVTIVLLVLGMSMYYRTILLDSNWWPLTEFGINVALFLLYMSAAIVYVNDTNRGGLCYYQLFKTPINASFCRVEGGQTAAIIFLFVTVIIYLISAVVALKLWRHEAARRHRELMEQEMKTQSSFPEKQYESDDRPREEVTYRQLKSVQRKPELLNGHIPAGHIPKPIVMPDYLAKYPAIQTNEMRDRYKAVFNDQFSEYKELSVEIHAVLKKFDELDALMRQLPHHPESLYEQERISKVLQEYKKKKNDPAFLEKKERCEYLKNKLSHIKQRIQDYDKVMNWNVET
nr:PREDICTED: MARVEL domain-containing protein 2-like [Opisthocomus hoazin]